MNALTNDNRESEKGQVSPLIPSEIDIKRIIEVFNNPVAEIRVLNSTGVSSGYFDRDHHKEMVEVVAAAASHAGSVNITLNPVKPEILARSPNRLTRRAKRTTSDKEIEEYEFFFFDIDPKRPSSVSSTDDEHDRALACAGKISEAYSALGWPEPVIADSGNGAHVIYKVTLPNNATSRTLIEKCLAATDLMFSDEHLEIDIKTGNPSRLVKVYGTPARKGKSTPERPHRLSRILKLPERLEPVSRELLRALAARVPERKAEPSENVRDGFDLDAWIAQHHLPVASSSPWNGGRKIILNPCLWNPEHTNRAAYIVQFSNGAIAAGCHHNSCAGKDWFNLRDTIEPGWRDTDNEESGEPYYIAEDGSTWWLKPGQRRSTIPTQLMNFSAKIVSDLEYDDAEEVTGELEIEATLGSKTVPIRISGGSFARMDWPLQHLGGGARLGPGVAIKDRARDAIQYLSSHTEIKKKRIFRHTGWREHNDQRIYIHAAGGIGEDGVIDGIETDLPEPLRPFELPAPSPLDSLIPAVQASLSTLKLGPKQIMAPVLGAVYRSVLGPADFSVFLVGRTGAFKSELAALAQRHFGVGFDSRGLPTWESTENFLETLAFVAKDALLTIDDFKPAGGAGERQIAHHKADRVLRAQGNRSGRGRLRSDVSFRRTKYPRGLILATGEEPPEGASLAARMLFVEVAPGSIDANKLSSCQQQAGAGLYAGAMAGFIQWLASQPDPLNRMLPNLVRRYRGRRFARGVHRRTGEIFANLIIGWEYFLMFAQKIDAIDPKELDHLYIDAYEGIEAAAEAQRSLQGDFDPVTRFFELLNSALRSGAAHVADIDGEAPVHPESFGWRSRQFKEEITWQPQGLRVGWIDDDELYLDPEASYQAARRAASGIAGVSVSSQTLWKRLREASYLASIDQARETNKVRRVIEGRPHNVIHVKVNALELA